MNATHPKFVESIAKQYYKIYKTQGYDEAKEYTDRMIETEELREQVAKQVADLFAPSHKGGK